MDSYEYSAGDEVVIKIDSKQIRPPNQQLFIKVKKNKSHISGKRKSDLERTGWDNSFGVVPSRNNLNQHQYYREYFGKKQKEKPFHYYFKYSSDGVEPPGIA